MVEFSCFLKSGHLLISYKENGEILANYSIDYYILGIVVFFVVPVVYSILCSVLSYIEEKFSNFADALEDFLIKKGQKDGHDS